MFCNRSGCLHGVALPQRLRSRLCVEYLSNAVNFSINKAFEAFALYEVTCFPCLEVHALRLPHLDNKVEKCTRTHGLASQNASQSKKQPTAEITNITAKAIIATTIATFSNVLCFISPIF